MTQEFKLDPQLKQRWIAALRSGNYEQGRQVLRSNEDKYCCLGVLADIINPQAWEAKLVDNGNPYIDAEFGYYWNPSRIDTKWSHKYLVDEDIPKELQGTLTRKNDGELLNFLEIADYIESNL